MNPYIAWQESWDRQQEGYMPDREHRLATMLNAVEAVAAGAAPRVLDLAGGTGSISLRTLARFPAAEVTLLDVDPVLLTIAKGSLADRITVVTADLKQPAWAGALPHRSYDAVLTATALHWLPGERLADLYGEIREVLRPGGVFVNADHMPDDALPTLTDLLVKESEALREARVSTGVVHDWKAWWDKVEADEHLGPLMAERREVFPAVVGHNEWSPPAAWHVEALRKAGFSEVGLVWRGGPDAAVAAVR
jgi:SAM-dependent methyltransferase